MNTSTREEQFAIKDWLASHGFSAHISAFEANSIGREELLLLTEEDLKELGVRSLGERKRIIQQIAALKRPSFTSFIGKIGRLALSATQGIFIYSFISVLIGFVVLAQYAFASDAINYSTYANTYEHII